MDNYYIRKLEEKKNGNMKLYKETLVEVIGSELAWEEVQLLEQDTLRKLMLSLKNKIKVDQSPVDINKLARAIQSSRSGIGGSAMTPYKCHFCGKEDLWGNTAVPNICLDCSTGMATKIAMYDTDIMKEGVLKDGR